MTRLVKLAWRDVWRNRRRSLLTMGAIVFGILMVGFIKSTNDGTYDELERSISELHTGDIQIHAAGYTEDRTLDRSLHDADLVLDSLRGRYDWITAASRRIEGFALASSDSSSAGAFVMGIEPETEPGTLIRNVHQGNGLSAGAVDGVLLGGALARNLRVAPGDSVVLLTQGYHSVMGAGVYAVHGLIRTGDMPLDRTLITMTLPAARDLFAMPERFTTLVLKTDVHALAARRAADLDIDPEQFEVRPWNEVLAELQQVRELDDAGNMVIYAFLLLLIGVEIMNSTMMSMMERVREFGVMMAIGLQPRQVSVLVVLEMAIKVGMGVLAGALLISALASFLAANPIPLSEDMQAVNEGAGYSIEAMHFSNRPGVVVLPVVCIVALAGLSVIYPLLRLRQFTPVAALRSV